MEGGPAWIAWKEYDLQVLAVETTTAGARHILQCISMGIS